MTDAAPGPLPASPTAAPSLPADPVLPSFRALAPPLYAFVASVLPLFLTSTLASELRSDLGFSAGRLGISVAAFFAVGAVLSGPLGRLGERLGAGRSLRLSSAVTAAAMVWIALVADSWAELTVGLAVAGAAQALTEPAVNLYLARRIDRRRLGFAFGIKQAAVPAATLLGGVAVPTIALPFGWRWVFGLGAVIAAVAVVGAPASEPMSRVRSNRDGDVPFRPLVVLSVGVALASAAASTVAGFVVDGATEAGISTAAAGGLAALGGALGVTTRITSGIRADRHQGSDLGLVCKLVGIGVLAYGLLATRNLAATAVAIPAAYVTAWGWPALLHLAVVRRNPRAPSAATGIVNTGAFLGAVGGPVLFGWLATAYSYSAAWSTSAAWAFAGMCTVAVADRRIGMTTTLQGAQR